LLLEREALASEAFDAPRGTLAVVGGAEHPGLAAQLLAVGVEQVLVMTDQTLGPWRQVLGDAVATLGPPRRRWRTPKHVVVGQTPVARRAVLGLPVRCPIDLSCDDADRTLAALALLRAHGRIPDDDDGGFVAAEHPASRLVVSGCTACGVCVQACPVDALVLSHDGTTSVLVHSADRCRSAAQCVRLCPSAALVASARATFAQVLDEPVVVLATITTTTCPRCGARHVGDPGSWCPLCTFRRTHVFGSGRSSAPHAVAQDTTGVAPYAR